MPKKIKTQKEVLGFAPTGSITIFKGDTYPYLEWFRSSEARYTRNWGWYFVSGAELPEDCPEELEPIVLNWDDVAVDEDNLKSEKEIAAVVDSLIYDPGESEWIGEIGDRLELVLTIDKAAPIEGAYGSSTFHIMHDDNGNIFTWSTTSKTLLEGQTYLMRGTVKAHNTYHNNKQTQLIRCMIRS